MLICLDGGNEKCAWLVTGWDGWNDWTCNNPEVVQCACEKSGQMFLKMRGLCSESTIDTFWTPQTEEGQYILQGLMNSIIEFNNEKWNLKALGGGITEPTLAFSDISYHSFVMGKSNWFISNDKGKILIQMLSTSIMSFAIILECNKGKPYNITMKLSGCADNEFTCDDGQCIQMRDRCDQILDCRDKSDEQNCKIIIIKDGYNNAIPPFRLVWTFLVNSQSRVSLESI